MATLEELLQAINPANTYQRYIGQPFANVAGPFGRGFLGLGRPEYGSEQAYRTGQAVSNMPAAGIPAGAMKAAAQVPGLLADVVQAAKGSDELAGLLALTAYHGSPHRFSKFDASKIGTGEGAQAYGHGLYFAENPMVADEYRMMLSTHQRTGDPGQDLANYALRMKPNNEEAINWIKNEKQKIINQSKNSSYDFADKEYLSQYDNAINVLQSGLGIKPGSFYTVDIPDEMIGKMLDWDKPLGKQSPEIRKAFESLGFDTGMLKSSEELHGAAKKILGSKQFAKMANEDIYFARDLAQAKRAWNAGPDSLNEYMNTGDGSWLRGVLTGAKGGNQSGGVAYKALADKMGGFGQANYQGGGQLEASRVLRELGIPGISYLDQGSRNAGKGTRNFVVFPGEEEAIRMMNVE